MIVDIYSIAELHLKNWKLCLLLILLEKRDKLGCSGNWIIFGEKFYLTLKAFFKHMLILGEHKCPEDSLIRQLLFGGVPLDTNH
jgi:hypothetical protein